MEYYYRNMTEAEYSVGKELVDKITSSSAIAPGYAVYDKRSYTNGKIKAFIDKVLRVINPLKIIEKVNNIAKYYYLYITDRGKLTIRRCRTLFRYY